jgi:hypothetical protein
MKHARCSHAVNLAETAHLVATAAMAAEAVALAATADDTKSFLLSGFTGVLIEEPGIFAQVPVVSPASRGSSHQPVY